MTSPLLETRALTLWRGETLVVDALDLEIGTGDVVQLAGPNGSGKSTLLRALAGLVEPDEGEILRDGRALRRAGEAHRAGLLYLGHKAGISAALDPRENLRALLGPAANGAARLDAALGALGLGARLDLPCRSLSAGQQRRVALARLALERRALWLLDEPLTALDADGREWVRGRIAAHARAGGAVLYTTHQSLSIDGVRVRTLALEEAA